METGGAGAAAVPYGIALDGPAQEAATGAGVALRPFCKAFRRAFAVGAISGLGRVGKTA